VKWMQMNRMNRSWLTRVIIGTIPFGLTGPSHGQNITLTTFQGQVKAVISPGVSSVTFDLENFPTASSSLSLAYTFTNVVAVSNIVGSSLNTGSTATPTITFVAAGGAATPITFDDGINIDTGTIATITAGAPKAFRVPGIGFASAPPPPTYISRRIKFTF
jgi:hypothetical protein